MTTHQLELSAQQVSPREQAATPGLTMQRAAPIPSACFLAFGKSEIEQSIARRFERQAERYADHLAIKTPHLHIRYRDLNRVANRIAHALLARGQGSAPIAVLLEHGAPVIAAIIGALKAGKTYVPLDASFPAERNRHILQNSGASLMLASSGTTAAATLLAANVGEPGCSVLNIDQLAADLPEHNPALALSPDSPAYIIYTSGSTGQPKGVVQNHRNVLNDVRQYTNALCISFNDRMTLLYSCSVNGAVRGIFGALLNGASLYPFDVKTQGLGGLAELLMGEEITIYHSVPAVFRHFVATLTGQEKFPKLRVIRFGGEHVLAADVALYKKHFSDDCLLYTGMGATETGHVREYFIDKQTEIAGSVVPTGYAIEDKEVVLLDDAQQAVGAGEIGEIAVRSEYLALGYWNKPQATQAAFLPAEGTARLYLTGDLGRLRADGCLEHLGRKDFQVKVRGYRIELAEIERRLLEHPSLKETVVVAQTDRHGENQLVAYVVAAGEPKPVMSELRGFLQEKVPDYMLPAAFVLLDAVPLTPNGKIDRRALPAPDRSRADEDSFVAPSTPNEEALAAIWAEILKLGRVGIHDNFFELGGHSLLATQVVSRVRKSFDVDASLSDLFEQPTVAGFAEAIIRLRMESVDPDELLRMLAELEDPGPEQTRVSLQ
ncbi:MAG: non-ribosomal peptide synthetase [Burkholderiales bacterium]|nr:non-ribosomal peptide synthetase [Burkholderiales bacterium]